MKYDVVVVGAGFAGLCMAIKLKQAGLHDFVVLEKAGRVGGTWRDNTYPGAGCDVMSLMYSYSFAPNRLWTRMYAGQREILGYIDRLVADNELAPYIRLNTEAAGYMFDAKTDLWTVRTGSGEEITARIVVAGQGPLHHPKIPDIPGLSTFTGPMFHSARWDHSVDLTGKRVAVIGNGASAVQFVPQIAPQVSKVTVFQRSPHWIIPKMDRPLSTVERALFLIAPVIQRAYRYGIYWFYESATPGFLKPRYMKGLQALAHGHLVRQVHDPELRKQLTPDYVIGCKRILVSSDYYPTLARSNVDLVTTRISSITSDAVVTEDGTRHEADVIVFATGFHITDIASTMDVTGVDGVTIQDAWKDGMTAYLGVTVAGFPNFFLLLGPNSGGGNQSIIFMIEAQVRYIMGCLRIMGRADARRIEIKPHVQERFNRWVHRRLKSSVWNAGGCTSWYLDANGVNRAVWPGSSVSYWRRMRRPNEHHYSLTPFEGDLDETHRSPAVVTADGTEIAVEVHLAGHLQPIDGSYQWYGRITRHPEVTALHKAGHNEITVRLPDGAATKARLTEFDPWGNVRVTGTGQPPFPMH
jgi:cation diffusion facilitator CzcD-associated flavoprotein CzcO